MRKRKEAHGFALIFGYLGIFMILIGFLTLAPLLLVIWHQEEAPALAYFLPVGLGDMVIGATLFSVLLFKRKQATFKKYEESSLLFIVWLVALLSGALPFFLAHISGRMATMNFSAAFFESTSAYTSTGQTAFADYVDVEGAFCPYVYCFHRSLMQFVGGIGLVLVLTMVLGRQGNLALYSAEGHNDKLLPSLGRSSKLIFGIYTLYTLLGTLALYLFGLPWFDAVNTSMCALAGGGMSVRANNIGAYGMFASANPGVYLAGAGMPLNPVAVEITVDVLVYLSAISFVLHLLLLTGRFKKFFRDAETRFALIVSVGAILISFLAACHYQAIEQNTTFFNENTGSTLRYSSFTIIAATTTSGFTNTTLQGIASLGKPTIILATVLMLIGGGAGSTAGGIKQFRIVVCLKSFYYSLQERLASTNQLSPQVIYRHGKVRELSKEGQKESFVYLFAFMGVFLFSIVGIAFLPGYGIIGIDAANNAMYSGFDGITVAAFDVASAMSNTGLALNSYTDYMAVQPVASHFAFWILSLDMFFGRLEIFPILYAGKALFQSATDRINHKKRAEREASVIDVSTL